MTPEEAEHVEDFNFDHPDAFDFPELLQVMQQLKKGNAVEIPRYDYVTNSRLPSTTTIKNARVVRTHYLAQLSVYLLLRRLLKKY